MTLCQASEDNRRQLRTEAYRSCSMYSIANTVDCHDMVTVFRFYLYRVYAGFPYCLTRFIVFTKTTS
jgi:hypothetical protein